MHQKPTQNAPSFLCDLIAGEPYPDFVGSIPIASVHCDSRLCEPGSLFFAMHGTRADGLRFCADAVQNGAVAVVVERGASVPSDLQVPVVAVANVRKAYAKAVNRYWGKPSDHLSLVGVTGTNGKTSVAWLVTELAAACGRPWLQVGTLGARVLDTSDRSDEQFEVLANTTPDAGVLQAHLAHARARGVNGAICEVSSHASAQARTHHVMWDALIFTNLSRDHLDYHGTMEAYAGAKYRLFTEELAGSNKEKRLAVVCVNDEYGERLAERVRQSPGVTLKTYSAAPGQGSFWLENVERGSEGSRFTLCEGSMRMQCNTQLVGDFNVDNVSLALICLLELGFSSAELERALPLVRPVPGRLERIDGPDFSIFVDYAHTPEALRQVSQVLRQLTHKRLITVFGCGGDRDKGKRSEMFLAANEAADILVVTSDNPRNEPPAAIIDDILRGQSTDGIMRIEERRAAIEQAVKEARAGDVVLIAGKGHEPYQEIADKRLPFDDREVAREAVNRQQP